MPGIVNKINTNGSFTVTDVDGNVLMTTNPQTQLPVARTFFSENPVAIGQDLTAQTVEITKYSREFKAEQAADVNVGRVSAVLTKAMQVPALAAYQAQIAEKGIEAMFAR